MNLHRVTSLGLTPIRAMEIVETKNKYYVRDLCLALGDIGGYATITLFADSAEALMTAEERTARVADPAYTPTLAEALADPASFVAGMTETRAVHGTDHTHDTGGGPVG